MKEYQKSELGFTLVELSMVIVISGLIMAFSSWVLHNYMALAKSVTTSNRIEAINDAIGQYLAANGKYPCPASYSDPPDTATFGTQVLSCDDWTATPGGTYKNGGTATDGIRVGAVPVRTLGLSEQYMEDGWGSRFTYVVSQALTQSYSANGGKVQVKDRAGNPIENTAHYAVISHGSNRIGGYTHQGKLGIPCPAFGVTWESNNCAHTPQNNAFKQTLYVGTRVGTATSYDDIVTFHVVETGLNNTTPVFQGTVVIFDSSFNNSSCPAQWVYVKPESANPPKLKLPYIYCQKI